MLIVGAGITLILAALFFGIPARDTGRGNLDAFAQCLADEKITMYGANWCPHCQNEKNAFGDSFRFIPYVECPDEPKQCLDAGISGYPTWIFPDGRRFKGEQGIEKLSQESGCALDVRQ